MAYFDWNATAPLLPAARNAWLQAVDNGWGNPSTAYRVGTQAKVILDEARKTISQCLRVRSDQVIFTSGATESNNAFIRVASARASSDEEIWISAIEHPSVREAALHWWGKDKVITIPATPEGVVDLSWMHDRIHVVRPALICVMAVNNETGIIQPFKEINEFCFQQRVSFFSDAVQWMGKGSGSFNPGTALAGFSLSAHKFGGPKGIGCLVLGDEWTGSRLQVGGGQEFGSRAGTEDVAGISAMAAALQERMNPVTNEKLKARDRFEDALSTAWPDVCIHGKQALRVWNTCSVSLPEFNSHRWIARLDKKGFQVSTGAACSAGKKGPSVVMQAMGVEDEAARRTLRISSGWETNPEDWDALLDALIATRKELQEQLSDTGPGEVIQI